MAEYIEKKALLAYLENVNAAYISSREFKAYEKLVSMIGEIESGKIPAADVEPVRHWHWEPPIVGVYGCVCSLCKKQADNDFDYCPNCGALMGGDKNGNA